MDFYFPGAGPSRERSSSAAGRKRAAGADVPGEIKRGRTPQLPENSPPSVSKDFVCVFFVEILMWSRANPVVIMISWFRTVPPRCRS